jgi:hypothetical protein
MKIAAFFSLLAGWLLVLAALILLPAGAARSIFTLAGIAVEATGLVLAVRTHMRPADAR